MQTIIANLDQIIQWGVYALTAVVLLWGGYGLVRVATSRPPAAGTTETATPEVAWPKCEACGVADAMEPKPLLTIKRTGLLRFVFGMYALAPMYRRQVRKLHGEVRPEDLTYCTQCAPLADALTDRFVMTNVRAKLAKVNEEIAIDVTTFLRDGLSQQMRSTSALSSNKPVSLAPVSKLALRSGVLPGATGTDP